MNGPYEGRIEKWSSAWLSPGGNCSWVIPRSTISPVLRSTGSMYLELFEVCARQRKRDVVNKKWWSIGIKVGAVWWRGFANEHVSTETAIDFRNVYRICKTDHRNWAVCTSWGDDKYNSQQLFQRISGISIESKKINIDEEFFYRGKKTF